MSAPPGRPKEGSLPLGGTARIAKGAPTSASPFDNILRAAARALDDVVGPAVDSANPLATEQLRLVCRFLELVRQRAGFVADMQRAELQSALDLAGKVSPHAAGCPGKVRDGLASAQQHAEKLLASVAPDAAEVQQVADRLNAHVSCVVRFAGRFERSARQAVERATLEGSRRVVELRRAWLSPLGLDPEPSTVPVLDSVLRPHGPTGPL